MRRSTALALLCALVLPGAAAGQTPDPGLQRSLSSAMRGAGSASGAYVMEADTDRPLFALRERKARILASNTKLFTTAAALAQYGVDGTLATEVLGDSQLSPEGVYPGDLYLRGGGDPTFGTESFTRRAYGRGATVEELVSQLEAAGIREVRGRVVGDESRWDSRRGGPDSGFGPSADVGGPLSALAFNRGLGNEGGSSFQPNPPAFAAGRLDAALEQAGVEVRGAPRAAPAPAGAQRLAAVASPPMSRLAALTNKPSDNYLAEMLLKGLGAQAGRGTTMTGARATAAFAQRLGVRSHLVDGSGLARSNRAAPREVAELLDRMLDRDEAVAFDASMAVAGRDGTLRDRMRRGPARGNCRGKTGTINGVSTLSGYCRSRSGKTLVFSFLMNGVSAPPARRIQDRMAQMLAGWGG